MRGDCEAVIRDWFRRCQKDTYTYYFLRLAVALRPRENQLASGPHRQSAGSKDGTGLLSPNFR